MELASGYSDSINYGNGYTPLATNAINNNNADYARNQAAIALMAQQAQNNVFASGGGFGNQTAYYAGLGADYGRATGGFGGYGAANADPFTPVQSGYPSGDVQRGPDLNNLSVDPFGKSGGGIGSDAVGAPNQPDPYQQWLQSGGYGGGAQPQPQIPAFWQGVRDFTGMGAPGGSGYDPYAGLGNQGQQGVVDPMGYGSGGYQGNAISDPGKAPVQGGPDIGPFWQGIRDLAGADPKDQSRIPNAFGTGAEAFNTYNQPDPYQQWLQSSGAGGAQPKADPYYWSGNFFGANNGSGIGQGAGMSPGMGGFNNPAVPTSPQQWYANGGYNPYNPQTYGGSALQNLGTGQPNVSTPGVFGTGADPYQDWLRAGGYGGGATDFSSQGRPAYDKDPGALEAIRNTAFGQINPTALSALFTEESGWNPRNGTIGGNYGVAQMAPGDFQTAGGTLGGLTYNDYTKASAADQIGAYADLLARTQARNPGLDFSTMTPERQYAVLQAFNFGPQTTETSPNRQWLAALLRGDTSVPTAPGGGQAEDLKSTSIADMERAYLLKHQ